jgi:hypothetical protein
LSRISGNPGTPEHPNQADRRPEGHHTQGNMKWQMQHHMEDEYCCQNQGIAAQKNGPETDSWTQPKYGKPGAKIY